MSYSQPGIVNALDFGMSSGGSVPGVDNAFALQDAITYASNHGGGIVLIPSDDDSNHGNTYRMAPQTGEDYCVEIPADCPPLLILGTGPGTTLKMLQSGTMFRVLNTSAVVTSLVFQDLTIVYDQSGGNVSGTAFDITSFPQSRLFRITVQDCPTAVNFSGCLQASILECSFTYSDSYPGLATTCIIVGEPGGGGAGSNQVDIDASLLTMASALGGSVGISITKVDGLRVRGTEIDGFDTGISCTPPGGAACQNIWISDTKAASTSYGAYVQPKTNTGKIYNINFANCTFSYSGTSGTTSGIYVDANSGVIDTVRFDNCTSYGFSSHGLQIVTGENVIVIGGLYSSNEGAGIAVTDAAQSVLIASANCPGNAFSLATTQNNGVLIKSGATNVSVRNCVANGNTNAGVSISNSADQIYVTGGDFTQNSSYGISVTSSCSDVYIDGCDVSGYSSGNSIHVSTPGTLQVINCAGYNDQGKTFTSPLPGSAGFNGVSYGYYGPVVLYISGGTITSITIGGSNTNLKSGTFFIPPPTPAGGPYAVVSYTGTPNFLLVGQ